MTVRPHEPQAVREARRLDLNRVTRSELLQIQGISASRADAILRYRDEHGGFSDVTQLGGLHGFDGRFLEKIKDYFYIGGSARDR